MFNAGKALTQVPLKDLKKTLAFIHRGDLHAPLDATQLNAVGLGHVYEPLLNHVRGLDRDALVAVLVAVIAERVTRSRAGS